MSPKPALQSTNTRGLGILVYGMYDISAGDRAPKVRIEMISRALAGQAPMELITGAPRARAIAAFRWILGGGPKRIDAVYVESSTSTAMPGDLAFLLLMRLLGKPVGVYFRDAYQYFRDLYPRTKRRQALADWIWRVTTPLLRALASHHFTQGEGLARILRLRNPILVPPAGEPEAPDLGAGDEPLVAYVGGSSWADGFDRLVDAVTIARRRVPEARLRIVSGGVSPERQAALPELLRDARVCAIPRPITPYTSLALPVKLFDYLSLGKPVVSTAATETKRILDESEAGISTGDSPEELADGLVSVLCDRDLARKLAGNARRWACAPENTWDARAATILRELRAGKRRAR